MKVKNSKENLCDYCCINEIPICLTDDVKFGDGFGNDNIIECSNCKIETKEVFSCPKCGWESMDPDAYETDCGQTGCNGRLTEIREEEHNE